MKKTRFILLHFFIILLIVFAVMIILKIDRDKRYEYYSHHIYYSENGQKIHFELDGTEYEMGVTLDSSQIGELIGFLDEFSYPIYDIKGDNNRNLLYISAPSEFKGSYWGYHRTDFVLPVLSVDTVEKVEFSYRKSKKTINDIDLIKELLVELEADIPIEGPQDISENGQLVFYFKDIPGLVYNNGFLIDKEKGFMTWYRGQYIKLSDELFERLKNYI